MAVESKVPSTPGAAAFFTPHLVLAATLAAVLSQLGLSLGFTVTITLFLALDFLSFRFLTKWDKRRDLVRAQEQEQSYRSSSQRDHVAGAGDKDRASTAVGTTSSEDRRALVERSCSKEAAEQGSSSALAPRGLRLCMDGRVVYFNADEPVEFENESFKGKFIFLVVTDPPDPKWSSHFEGVNRTFEMQIQGKLKALPKGEVYMGGELEDKPKLGMVTQAMAKVVMTFAKQMVRSLHFSLGDTRPPADPLHAEKPHVTFPLFRAMDYMVATPDSEAVPVLGTRLAEPEEGRVARKSGKTPDVVWSTDMVYTMSFRSNTVNFQDWAVINVPGQGKLDLNTFLCKQPLTMAVYDLTAPDSMAHRAKDKCYMFRCSIINDAPGRVARPPGPNGKEEGGEPAGGVLDGHEAGGERFAPGSSGEETDGEERCPSQTLWGVDVADAGGEEEAAHLGTSTRSRRVLGTPGSPLPTSPRAKPRLVLPTPSQDEKAQEVSGKGLIKSGDILPLLLDRDGAHSAAVPEAWDGGRTVAYLSEGNGGAAVMRGGNAMPTGIQMVKIGGSSSTFKSDFLYHQDVVVLHHPETRKFVSIGRAWGLGWSPKVCPSKSHFLIKGVENGRPLVHGQAFSLSSRRWSDWDIGVSHLPSSKLGGRGLGCVNPGKRRNVGRYFPLTLVARPWFDPVGDGEGGTAGGVIPALEAEADAITINARGPFQEPGSGDDEKDIEEEGEHEGGEDDDQADPGDTLDEGAASASDLEEDFEAEGATGAAKAMRHNPCFGRVGIAPKASRAMSSFRGGESSLRVSVPAWVEFLHRDRRQGQLAFMVSVHAVPMHSSSSCVSKAASEAEVLTLTPALARDEVSSSSTATGPNDEGVGGGTDGGVEKGDVEAASPRWVAWTCVRTGRDLSSVVQMYRESVAAPLREGKWESRPRPRVLHHMSTADQSVRLMNHELAEIQRWEASFRVGDESRMSPVLPMKSASLSVPESPLAATPRGDEGHAGDGSCGSRPEGDDQEDGDDQRDDDDQEEGDRDDGSLPGQAVLRSSSSAGSTPCEGFARDSSSPRASSMTRDGSEPRSDPPGSSTECRDKAVSMVDEDGGEGHGHDDGNQVSEASTVTGNGGSFTSPYRELCKVLTSPGELDHHFLSGSSASDLNVVIGPGGSSPVLESVVARCLWESHWREEWAVVFPSHMACFAPMSNKPAWVLALKSLLKASAVPEERCPFPGLRCLRLETIGRVYYLCFAARSTRDKWISELGRLGRSGDVIDVPPGLELGHDPREMYVVKTRQWRQPTRLILNARRTVFDMPEACSAQEKRAEDGVATGAPTALGGAEVQPWQLSAELLRAVFRLSTDPGSKRLVSFLDKVVELRRVELSALDLGSEEALCFFANLYHVLVSHMLLVLGSPSPKNWASTYTEVSYEVGGDVFSLFELEHCVLRGRLTRPNSKELPKRFPPLPPEWDDHYMYALAKADSRISLFLNNGSLSNPPVVVLLSPGLVDEQLNRACQAFVDHTVQTDGKRRQIRVHKAFQLYAGDLQAAATSKDMIRYGLRFAGRAVIVGLSRLDVDISQATVRYHPYVFKCHEAMSLVDISSTRASSAAT